jgi:hypothetical protein
VDLRRLKAGVSSNTDPVKAEQLRTTSQATAPKMISDVDLYDKTGKPINRLEVEKTYVL